jgi:hypothetical protein
MGRSKIKGKKGRGLSGKGKGRGKNVFFCMVKMVLLLLF